jgi:hypothetical protein
MIGRCDEVEPEDEINHWLCPPQENEDRPGEVPTTDEGREDQPELVRMYGLRHPTFLVTRKLRLSVEAPPQPAPRLVTFDVITPERYHPIR